MRNQQGFTLVEIIVVVLIMAILLGFITINLIRSQQNTSLTSTEEVLVADLRQQQLKAMIGDTEGRASADSYGVHFDANKYVLFHGTYSATDSANTVINLQSNMQFNSSNFNVIFSKLGGSTSARTIDLQDNTNSGIKRAYINVLGTVTEVDSL
jgi:prepilin-type N-terminal cleavage/methylation domain-containing protein